MNPVLIHSRCFLNTSPKESPILRHHDSLTLWIVNFRTVGLAGLRCSLAHDLDRGAGSFIGTSFTPESRINVKSKVV